jgi:carboxylesterase
VRPLGEALAARGFHVHAPLLPGHGLTPDALRYVTWRDWLRAADEALTGLLGRFDQVSVAGLSMGALLALVLAARRVRVRRLALLAPVVQVQDRGARLLQRVRHTPLARLAPEWVIKTAPDIELPDVRAASPLTPRYPAARILDLFELQDLARVAEGGVKCPSLVLASAREHVVDLDAVLALGRRLPLSRTVVLQRGWHIIPRDADRALALSEVGEFFDLG